MRRIFTLIFTFYTTDILQMKSHELKMNYPKLLLPLDVVNKY